MKLHKKYLSYIYGNRFKIVKAAVQGQIPDVEPAVAIQTITPPAVPECMADEIAQTQNPENALDQNFVPGASCSLAAQECFQNMSLSFSWLLLIAYKRLLFY